MSTATAPTARRMTKVQLAKALAALDAKLAAVDVILDAYAATFETVDYSDDFSVPLADAWNGAHDLRSALVAQRRQVELNPRPIPAGEYGTYLLAVQNID